MRNILRVVTLTSLTFLALTSLLLSLNIPQSADDISPADHDTQQPYWTQPNNEEDWGELKVKNDGLAWTQLYYYRQEVARLQKRVAFLEHIQREKQRPQEPEDAYTAANDEHTGSLHENRWKKRRKNEEIISGTNRNPTLEHSVTNDNGNQPMTEPSPLEVGPAELNAQISQSEAFRGRPYANEYEVKPFELFTKDHLYRLYAQGGRVKEFAIGAKKQALTEAIRKGADLLTERLRSEREQNRKREQNGKRESNRDTLHIHNPNKGISVSKKDFIEGICRTQELSGTLYELRYSVPVGVQVNTKSHLEQTRTMEKVGSITRNRHREMKQEYVVTLFQPIIELNALNVRRVNTGGPTMKVNTQTYNGQQETNTLYNREDRADSSEERNGATLINVIVTLTASRAEAFDNFVTHLLGLEDTDMALTVVYFQNIKDLNAMKVTSGGLYGPSEDIQRHDDAAVKKAHAWRYNDLSANTHQTHDSTTHSEDEVLSSVRQSLHRLTQGRANKKPIKNRLVVQRGPFSRGQGLHTGILSVSGQTRTAENLRNELHKAEKFQAGNSKLNLQDKSRSAKLRRNKSNSDPNSQDDVIPKQEADPLLLFADVDVTFNEKFLQRCRLHAIPGRRVYYPVVFSLYNPDIVYRSGAGRGHHFRSAIPSTKQQLRIAKTTGFWRDFGYGMSCQHSSDYLSSGGFNMTLAGWGYEDVVLYRRMLKTPSLTVVRAPDPGIFHLYHEKHCNSSMKADQYQSCLSSKALTEGSHEQLGRMALQCSDQAPLT